MRDLHRGHEKDEKDKERAKAEVARLNGMTAGGGAGPSSIATSSGLGRGPTPSGPKVQAQATPAQRKQQLAQLAEMGVSIPDGYRPEMAMPGEWQVTAERIIEPDAEKKPEALALGVRKRVVEDEEGEAEVKKRRWGSTYKTHPETDDTDLDALLKNVTRKDMPSAIRTNEEETKPHGIKEEPGASGVLGDTSGDGLATEEKIGIKMEPSEGEIQLPAAIPPSDASVKQEEEDQNAHGVVFKKRKAKNIRQK